MGTRPVLAAALAGIPVGNQRHGVWAGRRQMLIRFAGPAETATMYTSDALAREVSRLYPHIRILLTTGYAKDALARADIQVQEFELIPKPYQPADLPRKIRAVLDA